MLYGRVKKHVGEVTDPYRNGLEFRSAGGRAMIIPATANLSCSLISFSL